MNDSASITGINILNDGIMRLALKKEVNYLVRAGYTAKQITDLVNKAMIEEALRIHNGNQSKASAQLKISRGTFRKWMK